MKVKRGNESTKASWVCISTSCPRRTGWEGRTQLELEERQNSARMQKLSHGTLSRLGRQNPGLKKGPHERLRGASAMAIYTPLQRALQLGSHGVARLLRSEEAARENADDGSRDRHNSAHHSWEEAACTATEAELSASITDKKGFAVCVRGRIRRRPLCREHGNELRTRTRNQTARKRRARSPAACLIACPSGGMTLYIYIYIYIYIHIAWAMPLYVRMAKTYSWDNMDLKAPALPKLRI